MSRDSAYFRVLIATIGVIIVAGVGRLFATSAAEELARHQTAVSPMQLETLAEYLRPVQPSAPPALVEPAWRPAAPAEYYPPMSGSDEARARAAPRWVVSAILITDARRVAVVNEDLVAVGSTVRGGARVTAIEPDHVVVVEPDGRRRVLSVAGNN